MKKLVFVFFLSLFAVASYGNEDSDAGIVDTVSFRPCNFWSYNSGSYTCSYTGYRITVAEVSEINQVISQLNQKIAALEARVKELENPSEN